MFWEVTTVNQVDEGIGCLYLFLFPEGCFWSALGPWIYILDHNNVSGDRDCDRRGERRGEEGRFSVTPPQPLTMLVAAPV